MMSTAVRPDLLPGALVLILSIATGASGERGPASAHLVRFTSEKPALASGGHLTPGCYTTLSAEISPPTAGVTVEFSIAEGTGAGRTIPAMLSAETVRTDAEGIARAFLLSSDDTMPCRVKAAVQGGTPLELRFVFSRTGSSDVAIAPAAVRADPNAEPIDAMVSMLAEQLADPSVEVRTAVKRRLVAMGRGAVSALVAVANDPRVAKDARSLAVRTLADMRDEEADDQLLALLAHPLCDVRQGAEDAIARMIGERAIPLAESALASEGASLRASGVRILARMASAETDRAVLAAAADADAFVRATAVWELARQESPVAAEAIRAGLRDEVAFVRVIASKSVVLLGHGPDALGDELYGLLRGLLADPEPGVRSAAVRAAVVLEDGRTSALAPSLKDGDVRVRRSLAMSLPWRADVASSLRMLLRLVDDADDLVRGTALRAVAEYGTEAEAGVLVEMLDSDDGELCELAARALRRVTCMDFGWRRVADDRARAAVLDHWRGWYASHGHETRSAWLWQALDLPGSSLRGEAGLQLARLMPTGRDRKKARLRAALRSILDSTEPERDYLERHAASEALMLLGDVRGVEALRDSLSEARQYVRLSAVKRIGSALASGAGDQSVELGRESVRVLVDALEEAPVAVRRSAERSLFDFTGHTFGYEALAPARHRAAAIAKWRRWLEGANRAPPSGADDARRSAP